MEFMLFLVIAVFLYQAKQLLQWLEVDETELVDMDANKNGLYLVKNCYTTSTTYKMADQTPPRRIPSAENRECPPLKRKRERSPSPPHEVAIVIQPQDLNVKRILFTNGEM